MIKTVTSLKNPLIKQIVSLQEKSRERKKTGLCIIEGLREISLAIAGGYTLQTILYCPEICSEESLNAIQIVNTTERIELSLEVYRKVAYRTSTEGILAIAQTKNLQLNQINFSTKTPLLLVAEAPEKPGNIGALLRTADAANVDAVLIANPKTDLFNPNIIRSSVGTIFTNTIATGTTSEIISYLKEKNIPIYSAILQESVNYDTCVFTKSSAIVVGTEATGLSEEWRTSSLQNIRIPMQGKIDSMNVSVAAGILIFEAKRQRGF